MKHKLSTLAHARSGDKGNHCNIGVLATSAQNYNLLCKYLTAEVVQRHFASICQGKVLRYELPKVHALNFILEDALDGGGTTSLRIDSQGKTLAAALLGMEIEIC